VNLTADTTAFARGLRRATDILKQFEAACGIQRTSSIATTVPRSVPATAPACEVRPIGLSATREQRKRLWRRAVELVVASAVLLSQANAGAQPASDASSRRLRKTTRVTVLRPIRATGRANAGYPLLQTTANVTRIVATVISPISWFF